MEVLFVEIIYETVVVSNEGDRSPHISQATYFLRTNENKRSDRESL